MRIARGLTLSVILSVLLAALRSPACAEDPPPAETTAPISLHPDNPRYLLWRGRPTVLVTSAEHYGAVLNGDFDYGAYLETLAADGMNHTRTFSGVYREVPNSFGITDNTLAPTPDAYIAPWPRSDTPGAADGGAKFDLGRWNDAYFERLHDFLRTAAAKDVVVEFTLFCPLYGDELWRVSPLEVANNVNGVGRCERTEVYTLKHADLLDVQLALTRKLVRELQDHDNVWFEVCNEPYFGGVTMEWQKRIVDEIVSVEKELPRRHLISLNVANGRAKVSDPHPDVSIYQFHYCVPPDTIELNWALDRPIGENETGFRGPDDLLYRTEGWDFILAGGALYNNLDYSFSTRHPRGDLAGYTSPGGGSAALRRQLRVLSEFIHGFDLVRVRPSSSVVEAVEPADLSVRALLDEGRACAVYLHVPLPNKPKSLDEHRRRNLEASISLDLPSGTWTAEWIDSKTGETSKETRHDHGGDTLLLRSPAFDDDIALRVTRR